MKPLLTVAVALFLNGCAAETPSAEEVRDQFQRGASGHGQIVPIDNPEKPNSDPTAVGSAPR
jgi:PBP1b-binding outer membrane lipoprotein LpoB